MRRQTDPYEMRWRRAKARRRRQVRRQMSVLCLTALIALLLAGGALHKQVRRQSMTASADELVTVDGQQMLSDADGTVTADGTAGTGDSVSADGQMTADGTVSADGQAGADGSAAADGTAAAQMRVWQPEEVTHVFFHSLIYDTAKAFDGDAKENGYNQVMTTVSEFNEMIRQMYEKGYVMVSPHDICQVNADGTVSRKTVSLPEGKIPFVLSQDDLSYYHYMDGDGFASKLVVTEDGKVRNAYVEDDGSVSIGAYDMVPLIDDFVEAHPDFAYNGHKGVIALTGYEGVLGYRTDEVYKTRQADRLTVFQKVFLEANPDFDWDSEVAAAKQVADAMKAEGWEFASHTWGHIDPRQMGYDATCQDTSRWDSWVRPIVGDTDILIFAFGADIGDWEPYTMDNPYFAMYKNDGFSIFCNVDGSQPCWVQFGSDYMRQGRRNLDGYRMYYNPELLSDLFDVSTVWDSTRPSSVPPIGGEAAPETEATT